MQDPVKCDFRERHPLIFRRLLMLLSLCAGVLAWLVVSGLPGIGMVIVGPQDVMRVMAEDIASGSLWENISASMFRVFAGFFLAFAAALPIAFLMGWYSTVRVLMEPWLQFFRTIPPIALIPLVIVVVGIRESAKISVIFFCSFLVMVIAIYQGVTNVDAVLIKAARTFGATDRHLFFTVIVPASFPYILVAARLGISTALTSLIASEMTGSKVGLGNMIQEASLYFDMARVIMGILVIGLIGLVLDKSVLFLERKLTTWQEVRKA